MINEKYQAYKKSGKSITPVFYKPYNELTKEQQGLFNNQKELEDWQVVWAKKHNSQFGELIHDDEYVYGCFGNKEHADFVKNIK